MNAETILMTALLGLVVIALTIGWQRSRRLRAERNSRKLAALRINQHLKDLMSQVQQHRGLVSLFLNGNQDALQRSQAKKLHVEQELARLAGLYDAELMTPSRWQRINDYWQALDKEALQSSADSSFEQHSELIRQILFLIGDVAEHAQLAAISPEQQSRLDTLWSKLPATAEAIGQARAVGAGVAAAGHCSSVSRIKLRYLQQQVKEALSELHLSSTEMHRQADEFEHKAGVFLTELEQKLLLPSAPATSAESYFQIATEALDAAYAMFERSSGELERKLAAAA